MIFIYVYIRVCNFFVKFIIDSIFCMFDMCELSIFLINFDDMVIV